MMTRETNSEDLLKVVKAGGIVMGVVEEIVKNKEEIIIKFLEVLEGKEAKARVNLDGIEFNVGKSKVKLSGDIVFTFVPFAKKK